MDRRTLLKAMGAGLAALTSRSSWGAAWPTDRFIAESSDREHRLLRDAKDQPVLPVPDEHHAVVIIGGGLAGLTAAFKLRDLDVVVLEKEPTPGGHARRASWEGVSYSLGGAYITAPYAPLDALYAEAGFTRELKRIPEPADAYRLGELQLDPFGENHRRKDAVVRDFARLRKAMLDLPARKGAPTIPVDESGADVLAWDDRTLAALLEELQLSPEVRRYVALYCRSAFSATPEELSAFAGANFLIGEVGPRYTFPGGTARAAELLAAKLERAGRGRIRTASLVRRVIPSRGLVAYHDGLDTLRSMTADVILFASPKFLAPRLIDGLPEAQTAAIRQAGRGSALVANLCLDGGPRLTAYDTWFQGQSINDVIEADWVARTRGPKRVLTAYQGMQQNRALLEALPYPLLAEQVVADVEKLLPDLRKHLVDVRLTRWGHAFVVPRPGYITRHRPIANRPVGPVLFAHSDGQGLPAFEAAIVEGLKGAREAKAALRAQARK